MEIQYRSHKIEHVCTNADFAQREYGLDMAVIISQRIGELKAADSIDNLVQFAVGRCHHLKGKRKNQYAMDLIHPFRLIFSVQDAQVCLVEVSEIVDYH